MLQDHFGTKCLAIWGVLMAFFASQGTRMIIGVQEKGGKWGSHHLPACCN